MVDGRWFRVTGLGFRDWVLVGLRDRGLGFRV